MAKKMEMAEMEEKSEQCVLGCAVDPSQRPAIPGWSRPPAVISQELSEVTAGATAETERWRN